jgi:hypothetical protein
MCRDGGRKPLGRTRRDRRRDRCGHRRCVRGWSSSRVWLGHGAGQENRRHIATPRVVDDSLLPSLACAPSRSSRCGTRCAVGHRPPRATCLLGVMPTRAPRSRSRSPSHTSIARQQTLVEQTAELQRAPWCRGAGDVPQRPEPARAVMPTDLLRALLATDGERIIAELFHVVPPRVAPRVASRTPSSLRAGIAAPRSPRSIRSSSTHPVQ